MDAAKQVGSLPLWRIPWLPVQWTGFLCLKYLVLAPIGLMMCAPFCWRDCALWPQPFRFWGTDDGGNPFTWGDHERPAWASRREWLGRWWYCAVRNPVTGFNKLFDDRSDYRSYGSWTATRMEPADLVNAGRSSALRWRVSGWMDGIRYVRVHTDGRYTEFWIGWKIGSPVPGMGITCQWRRRRRWRGMED